MLARAERSLLMMVDVQARLLPHIAEGEAVAAGCATLLQAAALFGAPVVACEQYPDGLGRTVPPLLELLGDTPVFPKLTFSAAADLAIAARLDAQPDAAVVICGIEAHVCVLQTALQLRAAGREVFVVADAVGSRAPRNAELALARMRQAGVQVVSVEMLLFEWTGSAEAPAFKAMSRLVR